MSKKSAKQYAFEEKRGNFSTRINANGRMQIMPQSAKNQEIIKAELRSTLENLFLQRRQLTDARNTHPQGSEEWVRIDQTLNRVRGHLGHVQKTLMEAKALHYALLFEFVANEFLSEEALSCIRQAVAELKGLPPKMNNA